MVLVTVSVHKRGLHPMEAVKAWRMHTRDDMSLDAILAEGECLNMEMRKPGRHALWAATNRVSQMSAGDLLPQSRYSNCGRRRALSGDDADRIVGKWPWAAPSKKCLDFRMQGPLFQSFFPNRPHAQTSHRSDQKRNLSI